MPKIYIHVDGGNVQGCYSDIDIEVVLVDLDNLHGAEDEERNKILAAKAKMSEGIDDGTLKDVL